LDHFKLISKFVKLNGYQYGPKNKGTTNAVGTINLLFKLNIKCIS